jgi:hypothetical protein|tara:strand:+ start:241 stop:480 length:240 start_codon:yes stop_codon:yes gene_type:complete
MGMISKKEFTEQVEKLLIRGGTDVMGAIVKICEDNKLEPESAKRLISQPLKDKLEAEAQSLNMVNRGKTTKGTITRFFE